MPSFISRIRWEQNGPRLQQIELPFRIDDLLEKRVPKRSENSTDIPEPSSGHIRTRNDHATETAEDYVEAILDVIEDKGMCRSKDLSEKFQVTHVTVNKTVKRLTREGLVVAEPYRPIELTAQGKKLAIASRKRHEIVFQFLLALGISPPVAATDSEGIEHHVSEETLRAMKSFVAKK